MKAVLNRICQYPNRYKLTNVETGEVLGTFDFDEVTGTVQQVGTEIDAELFDSIAADLAARVVANGGELKDTVVTFTDTTGTAANVASGDKTSTLWSKVKNWFSRLKALAFKDKISNADVADDAAIAQSKINGLESALAAKQNTITGGASTIASSNLTADRALVSNGSGKVGVSAVTSTELGYLDGVTSNIQSQFNGIENGNTVVGKAIADKNGNDIFDTYATKEGLTASSRVLFRTSQDLTDKAIGATVQVPVISGAAGESPKVDDYVYDEWGNFARLVSVASNGKWNVVPFAKASNSYTTSNPPPYPVKSVAGKTGAVSLAKGDVGLGNVDNVKQYSASNPPPYPVTSVNGKTGAVAVGFTDFSDDIVARQDSGGYYCTFQQGAVKGLRLGDQCIIQGRVKCIDFHWANGSGFIGGAPRAAAAATGRWWLDTMEDGGKVNMNRTGNTLYFARTGSSGVTYANEYISFFIMYETMDAATLAATPAILFETAEGVVLDTAENRLAYPQQALLKDAQLKASAANTETVKADVD